MKVIQVYGQNAVRVRNSAGESMMLIEKGIGFRKRKGDLVQQRPTTRIFIERIVK
ncbi:CAT RNA binding domain-containing protein [Ligilactobacillus acidipiscis]|jgi:hypothetical protein|uniref:CAT RNA binding domain-containing protein n=1 Tax=Ligilactobacillus acidipiscis TaxID=89059 RepID=UPI002FDA6123